MVLEISVVGARHLPKMDTFGSIDAFVTLQLGDNKFDTSVKKGNYSPDWNEIFHLSSSPAALILQLFDWNRATKNEKV
jgi:Ca2+-dependent lipid-binding protein